MNNTETQKTMASPKSYVIVGGVAGGMSCATRLRRLDPNARITVIERSNYVSYANCGLPYYVGGVIQDEADLLLQTPTSLKARFDINVLVGHEATNIDRDAHKIEVQGTEKGIGTYLDYDYLVLSPGAKAIALPIPGIECAFQLRTVEDVQAITKHLGGKTKSALIIGGGFIGLEVAENLSNRGLQVTIIEASSQLLPPLDPEMAALLTEKIQGHGVRIATSTTIEKIENNVATLSDGSTIASDLFIAAAGVRPDIAIAQSCGLEIGTRGGIVVDDDLRTNDPAIFAVGDAVEKREFFDSGASLVPLANVANRQGRRAADAIMGRLGADPYTQGTAIVTIFGLNIALTGVNEKRLSHSGIEIESIHSHPNSHATYFPGAEEMHIKVIASRSDGRILGAQIIGGAGVDKRIDVIATAIKTKMKVWELADLELAYAPQFGSAKDPINMIGYIAENRLEGNFRATQWHEIEEAIETGVELIDVRDEAEFAQGTIPGAKNIPLNSLRERYREIATPNPIVFCRVGQRGHSAQALLVRYGINAKNLDGGIITWQATKGI